MKVSIVTEGFQSTGYGHITRCLSLAQAFAERNIFPTLYVNGDENSKSFLTKNKFKIIDWLQHPTLLIAEIKNSDFLIIDSYLVGKEFYNNFSKHSKLSVYVDDNLRLDYPPAIILNGTVNSESFPYQKETGTEYLLGGKYIPLRNEFWNVPSRKIGVVLSSILITFGGQDIKNLTVPILKALNESFPTIKKRVVIGSGFELPAQIEKLKTDNVELFYSPAAKQMRELMLSSDIAISAAGQTLYELAVTGTPTIAIAVAENQKNNITEWKKKGFLLDMISHADLNMIRKIISQIEKLNSVTQRKKLCAIGKKNVDGQGARRTVQYLIDRLCARQSFYLRSAANSDSHKVFGLSNDPTVRSQSINRQTIEWENHIAWYEKKINSEDYIFLLAFDKNDNFIGQVRFEIENESAVISVSISKEFRGKGLSKKILAESCTKVFSRKNSLNSIVAYIRPDNMASIGGFKAAGFNFTIDCLLNDEKFLKFTLEKKSL
jgi:spore coat polysaccharide biosynthesis predicted glycosyltransferase SpsG/RimJ/RimL family protein N-acetyltransferase